MHNESHEGAGFEPELTLEMITEDEKQRLSELFAKLDKLEQEESEIEDEIHQARIDKNVSEDESNFLEFLKSMPELHDKYLKNDGELEEVREELRQIAEAVYPNRKEYDDTMTTDFGQIELNLRKIRSLLKL